MAIAMTHLSMKQGIKKLREKGVEAVRAEMQQIHDQSTYEPKHPSELTEKQ